MKKGIVIDNRRMDWPYNLITRELIGKLFEVIRGNSIDKNLMLTIYYRKINKL